jgi:hypothetical protein
LKGRKRPKGGKSGKCLLSMLLRAEIRIKGREKENETSKHKGFQRSGGGE